MEVRDPCVGRIGIGIGELVVLVRVQVLEGARSRPVAASQPCELSIGVDRSFVAHLIFLKFRISTLQLVVYITGQVLEPIPR